MTERYSGHVVCAIPLSYKCSKCGARAVSTIPLKEAFFGSVSLYGGSKEEQIRSSQALAVLKLKEKVTRIYQNEPLKSDCDIVGQCSACGNREKWQKSIKESTFPSILGSILAVLMLIAFLIISILLGNLIWFPVLLIAALLLLGLFSSNETTRKRTALKRQLIYQSTPAENRPVFIMPCEDIIKSIH